MLNLGGSCPRSDRHQVCDVINTGRISPKKEPRRGWEGAGSFRISTFKKIIVREGLKTVIMLYPREV